MLTSEQKLKNHEGFWVANSGRLFSKIGKKIQNSIPILGEMRWKEKEEGKIC